MRRQSRGAHRIRRGWKWAKKAFEIRERDDYKCQRCGDWGNEVDHIVPLRAGGAMWRDDNLQVLCTPCHVEKSRFEYGKEAEGTREWYAYWRELLLSQRHGDGSQG